ncbi:hypothetical protein GDO81_019960 [Engystomops pustulosus]|uniref:Semaphorin-5B n=1 Tax=Engystomops pustulosus TaxID=76066 RepID=A0AAV6ZN61_ENGPU|nr:hypothetical protein GDO81_019960 [Engystomops pustulosus]
MAAGPRGTPGRSAAKTLCGWIGFQVRQEDRAGKHPAPRGLDGRVCVGQSREELKGSWSCWSSWTQCSATCGGGHYQRTRTCTNPAPSNGGDICIGLHTEEALCNTYPCEVILPASSIDENKDCGGFSLIHLIATGVSCFFGSSLLTFVIYVYCQRCQRQSQESTVIHPATPNHLHYKGNSTPKNEKYTPMEFKTLNKNNLLPDDRTNFYPLQQTNVYTTTYYPSSLSKYDFRPDSSPGRTFTNS